MWSAILTIKTTISYTFYISCKIGQFIVAFLHYLLTACVHFFNKLFIVLTVIFEDFILFLQDVIQYLHLVWKCIVLACESITAAGQAILELIQHSHQFMTKLCVSAVNTAINGITSIGNGIRTIFTFIKQIVISFGDGVWFIIVFVPKSLISLCSSTYNYVQGLSYDIYTTIVTNFKLVYVGIVEFVYNCYYFVTDVPTESTIGLVIAICFAYVFVQFYNVFTMYLITMLLSFLRGLRLKYRQLKQIIQNILPRITFRNRSRLRYGNRPLEAEDDNDIKTTDSFCIVCQDNVKCILLLPCKHLCLCMDCIPGVMRYNGRCPICRERITSTMRVFT